RCVVRSPGTCGTRLEGAGDVVGGGTRQRVHPRRAFPVGAIARVVRRLHVLRARRGGRGRDGGERRVPGLRPGATARRAGALACTARNVVPPVPTHPDPRLAILLV